MITLLTDFGLEDPFVGIMKGVIAGIAPGIAVVDLTHNVAAFQIEQGAFLLEQSWRYFPKGTIHVAVVDPGVGSERRPILVESSGHHFIGPDNGIFRYILADEKARVRHLDQPRYWLPSPSHTFHGRDIFAPCAAHLAAGVKPSRLGTRISDALCPPVAVPAESNGTWLGAVLHIDRFGNLITNFRASDFSDFTVTAGKHKIARIASTYAHCAPGELTLIAGSSGFYEISVRNGSAAAITGLKAGAPLQLKPGPRIPSSRSKPSPSRPA